MAKQKCLCIGNMPSLTLQHKLASEGGAYLISFLNFVILVFVFIQLFPNTY